LAVQLSLAVMASAQEGKLYPIARNASLDGMVVVLDVPDAWEKKDSEVDIVWDTRDGERYLFSSPARAGRHVYDPRGAASWHGPADWVSANVPAQGELKFPSLGDEVDVFLASERFLPTTVNMLQGHRLLGWPFEVMLLAILGLSAVACRVVMRCSWTTGLLAGFTLAWICMDLRTTCDHVQIVQAVESRGGTLPIVSEIKEFTDRAGALIGSGTWSSELPNHVIAAHYCGYAFAEQPYVSPAEADFLVTAAPAGHVVCQHGPYYLLRRGAP
jgi:hypothetical protein